MEDYQLTLFDRVEAVKQIITKYGEENFYISFSGGKDSSVLSELIDEALPGNTIPRVYFNTGIEYTMMLQHVRDLAAKDSRIVIYNSGVDIQKMLKEHGYPFKSKEFSRNAYTYDRSGNTTTVQNYVAGVQHDGTPSSFKCPKSLRYIFSEDRKERLKISPKCCQKLKKDTSKRYAKDSGRSIAIIGVRQSEGGARKFHGGCTQFANNKLKIFKPLNPVSTEFVDWYVREREIQLCKLYYPPFNFNRTGCKGCPFAINIAEELKLLEKHLPAERKQCEIIWGPVYQEYRRIGYRKMKETEDGKS